MLNDGFQYLEQRDADNAITHAGVVSKESAFATADNKGIFDVIAEDLRALYDDMTSLGLAKLKADVQAMYDDMRRNPQFGSTAATAQAQKAVEAAQKAEEAYENAKTTAESVEAVIEEINNIEPVLENIQVLAAKAQTSESNAASSASAAATSETNAKASETAAKASETNASDSADLSKKWAVDTGSPDDAEDTDSPTSKTQSSRTWALYSKSEAEKAATSAAGVQSVIDNALDTLKDELNHKANALLMSDDGVSPFISQFKTDNEEIAVNKVYIGDSVPVGTAVWFNTKGA